MRLNRVKKYLVSSTKTYHRGFSLVDSLRSDDLNIEVARLFHQKSGAMVYNIKSNDNDNTFAPIVRTLPQNDTGCPHILQHLACCGSQRFPIRDPFFNMLRRSVNTYMNAWTGDDFTAYPFSSANPKDFGNLYNVYLDMCLKPLLNELDFRQEGWRYEINPQTGQKQLKGIVFNEMKGVYQNPDRQLYVEVANKLYASTPFGYDSGGKPDSIVKLSYQQVKNMHKYYYHPSNMSFYYYGNSDIKDSLSYLQEQYLHKFDYQNNIQDYRKKSDLLMSNMPQNLDKTFYTIYSSTAQTPNVSLTYNIGTLKQISDVDISCLNMLAYLLLQTNQAIFYQQFIQSKLADGFSMAGLNVGSVLSFGFTLKNACISEEEVLKKVERVFGQLALNGVNLKRLEEYLIQAQLDILTPKKTQGIAYLGGYLPFMANRLPLTNLVNTRVNLLSAVRKLNNKQQLSKLINQYFLKNKRKIVIKQKPNKQKANDFNDLKGLQISQNIIKTQQAQLKQRQQSQASNSAQCLPKLSLVDLVPAKRLNHQIISEGFTAANNSVKDIHVKIDKKDINFIRLVFAIDCQSQQRSKLLNYLDIWRYAIRQGIAVKGMTNKQVSSKMNQCCHDFQIKLEKGGHDKDPTSIYIVFTASCLNQTLQSYVQLLRKIIYQPQFNKEDLNNIFRSYKSQKVEQLLDGGVMQYCLDYGSSFISQQGKIFDSYNLVTSGIKVAENGEVPQQFSLIHKALQSQANIILIQHSQQHIGNLLDKIGIHYVKNTQNVKQPHDDMSAKAQLDLKMPSVSVTNAYDVNFCSQQYPGPSFLSKEQAHLTLLVEVLEQDYLHPKIRQKGGAYGARAIVRQAGTVALYSYMDPYSIETYNAFDQSIKQLLKSQISNDRLQQVKIKVLGAFDGPIVPQNECYHQIIKKYNIEQRNQYMRFIKQAEWSQIIQSGHKYLNQNVKSRVMFGKDVPKQFSQEKLKIPKQAIQDQEGEQAEKAN